MLPDKITEELLIDAGLVDDLCYTESVMSPSHQ